MEIIKYKSIILRFIKAFIGGALASMAGVTIMQPSTWSDLKSILIMLAFAGITGGFSGALMALEKYLNWTPENVIMKESDAQQSM